MPTNGTIARPHGKPSRYFIDYADPEWDGEPSYDHTKIENTESLQQARTLAARRMKDLGVHVGIYERFNLYPPRRTEPYAPWLWEDRWVEDGVCAR